MRLVKAGYEIITEMDPVKKIEAVARVCYKSEDKICEGSAIKMVNALVKSKHYAMLEHGSIIFYMDIAGYSYLVDVMNMLKEEYGYLVELRATAYSGRYIISGNMRAWVEFLENCIKTTTPIPTWMYDYLTTDNYYPIFEGVKDKLLLTEVGNFYVMDPEDLNDEDRYIHYDITVKFIVDRGVSHEIVRHRKASFAQESTRYCNYGKSGEVVFILPCFLDGSRDTMRGIWENNCKESEIAYHTMIQLGAKPQEARDVLNTSVKTEVVMTANLKEWVHFFNLRALGKTGAPHTQMLEVSVPLYEDMRKMFPNNFKEEL